MNIRGDVNYLIESFLEEVRKDLQHHFPAVQRYNLYKQFGSSRMLNAKFSTDKDYFLQTDDWHKELILFLKKNLSSLTEADYILCWLAILTASKVLFLWDESKATAEISPHQILVLAEGVLQGSINLEDAYWTLYSDIYIDREDFDIKDYNSLFAYSTVLSALKFIIFSEKNPEEFYLSIYDELVEGNIEFANEAVKAYSYTFDNHQMNFDSQKRLEFWECYLSEAIPQAWELAHSTHQP